MAAILDGEDATLIDIRTTIILLDRQLGEAGMMVERGKCGTRGGECVFLGESRVGKIRENLKLERERAIRGGGDARLDLGKFRR